jgi:hypothetical protein
VAVTLKEAVWPAVTVWLAGCVVIEGATGAIFKVGVAATPPEHPKFTIASSKTKKTRPKRTIMPP